MLEKARNIALAAGLGAAAIGGAEQLGEHRGAEQEKTEQVERMDRSQKYLARLESFDLIIEQMGPDKVVGNRSLPWYEEAVRIAEDHAAWLESAQAGEIARRLVRICPQELTYKEIREGLLKLPDGHEITEELDRYTSVDAQGNLPGYPKK
jgi:hypothetical protein